MSATGIALLDELAHGVLERRTTTLSRPDGRLLRDLSRYLVAIHEARSFDPGMETIWERLQHSLPALQKSLERVEMVRGEMAYIPMIIRRGVRLGLNELSDGYQAILVIMFDLMLRYAYLFSTLNDPLEGPATVIIDEIDLHLHVRWQRTVLRQLTALFPGTQFVVTTHSPAVVQAAIDDGHAIIVLRERDGAVQALRLSGRAGIGCAMPVSVRCLSKRSCSGPTPAIRYRCRRTKRKSDASQESRDGESHGGRPQASVYATESPGRADGCRGGAAWGGAVHVRNGKAATRIFRGIRCQN